MSVNVYDNIGGVGDVGGVVGTAVSASVLFLLGVANSVILVNIVRSRRKVLLLLSSCQDKGINANAHELAYSAEDERSNEQNPGKQACLS